MPWSARRNWPPDTARRCAAASRSSGETSKARCAKPGRSPRTSATQQSPRSGTYAAAGERLHLAQPAVWKHVQTLETDLGVALFERVGRRVRLTVAGRLVLDRAEQLLEGADRMRELAQDLRAGRAGTVTIGCLAPHVLGFLAPVVGRYRRAHPTVRVVLRDVELAPGAGALDPFGDALNSGTVDIVIG